MSSLVNFVFVVIAFKKKPFTMVHERLSFSDQSFSRLSPFRLFLSHKLPAHNYIFRFLLFPNIIHPDCYQICFTPLSVRSVRTQKNKKHAGDTQAQPATPIRT